MAEFTRTIAPIFSSFPTFPTGFKSWGHSGKGQFRDAMQVGRTWEERYKPFKYNSEKGMGFLAYVNNLYRNQTIFTIKYYHRQTPFGTVSGSLTVNGASQTGTSINTSAITGTLKRGDLIKFANINIVYDITDDVANGDTVIKINPPIYEGGSPANSSAITYTGVTFRAVLDGIVTMPSAEVDQFYAGLTLNFREVPLVS